MMNFKGLYDSQQYSSFNFIVFIQNNVNETKSWILLNCYNFLYFLCNMNPQILFTQKLQLKILEKYRYLIHWAWSRSWLTAVHLRERMEQFPKIGTRPRLKGCASFLGNGQSFTRINEKEWNETERFFKKQDTPSPTHLALIRRRFIGQRCEFLLFNLSRLSL